eukprot:COSAG04_NODE_10672_length_760_cov_0.992436_1_plen_72_part_10
MPAENTRFFIARVRALSLLMGMFTCAAQASCRCRWKPPTVPTSFAAADVSCQLLYGFTSTEFAGPPCRGGVG